MNGDPSLIAEFATQLASPPATAAAQVVLFPPAPLLTAAKSALPTTVSVGAQNCHDCLAGAFTGEVSPQLLEALAIEWVLLGHSERRRVFGEQDEQVGRKLLTVAEQTRNLRAVLCVGETLQEREQDCTEAVLERQLSVLAAIDASALLTGRLVVAYEPVWAIGTGLTAAPAQVQAAHQHIRAVLRRYGLPQCPVIYGGSVSAASAGELARLPEVDGFLVGGASLKVEEFNKIIEVSLKQRNFA